MKKAVGILVVVAVSVFAGAASAQMTDPGTGMMGRGMGWGYFGPGMTLGMMFLWGVVIVGLVVGIGWLVRQGRGSRRNDRGH
jgi:uncharacterized membrane protein